MGRSKVIQFAATTEVFVPRCHVYLLVKVATFSWASSCARRSTSSSQIGTDKRGNTHNVAEVYRLPRVIRRGKVVTRTYQELERTLQTGGATDVIYANRSMLVTPSCYVRRVRVGEHRVERRWDEGEHQGSARLWQGCGEGREGLHPPAHRIESGGICSGRWGEQAGRRSQAMERRFRRTAGILCGRICRRRGGTTRRCFVRLRSVSGRGSHRHPSLLRDVYPVVHRQAPQAPAALFATCREIVDRAQVVAMQVHTRGKGMTVIWERAALLGVTCVHLGRDVPMSPHCRLGAGDLQADCNAQRAYSLWWEIGLSGSQARRRSH